MGEARNILGGLYTLTTLAAIPPPHDVDVRAAIDRIPLGAASPFTRLGSAHTVRVFVIDRLVHQGPSQTQDHLRSSYVYFTASFDGTLDAFLDSMSQRLSNEADQWWGHCHEYPGASNRAALGRWVRRHQIETSLLAVAAPNESVARIRESLALRERVLAFAMENQGLGAEELQRRFRTAFSLA